MRTLRSSAIQNTSFLSRVEISEIVAEPKNCNFELIKLDRFLSFRINFATFSYRFRKVFDSFLDRFGSFCMFFLASFLFFGVVDVVIIIFVVIAVIIIFSRKNSRVASFWFLQAVDGAAALVRPQMVLWYSACAFWKLNPAYQQFAY